MTAIDGYLSELTLEPGGAVSVHLSAPKSTRVELTVRELLDGGGRPDQPTAPSRLVAGITPITVEVEPQETRLGSYYEATDPTGAAWPTAGQTLWAFAYPTLRSDQTQVIISWSSSSGACALAVSPAGHLTWTFDGQTVESDRALDLHTWHLVMVRIGTGRTELHHQPIVGRCNSRESAQFRATSPGLADEAALADEAGTTGPHLDSVVRIGAGSQDSASFTGKIGAVGVTGAEIDSAVLASGKVPSGPHALYWDPTPSPSGDTTGNLVDMGSVGLDMVPVNAPIGLVTGPNWSGDNDHWQLAPDEYAARRYSALHLADCRWAKSAEFRLPADLASGVYSVAVSHGDAVRHLPFVLRSPSPSADVVVVMPTLSYIALSGRRPNYGHAVTHTRLRPPSGSKAASTGSTLDRDDDGSGVCIVSRLRPLTELDPDGRAYDLPGPNRFATDMALVGMLKARGVQFDVITDEDLDRTGVSGLGPYRVAITGSHPAYATTAMLDAWHQYASNGGRTMYLGGGGFYWAASYGADRTLVEVRRGESGSRPWQSEPGEFGHAHEPEQRCGLWRTKGRAPQKLFAVGLAAEGRSAGVGYQRMPDSYHRSVSWIFEGADDLWIGDRSSTVGGAAALEVDRYDRLLGSPQHARLLASAMMLPEDYLRVPEEVLFNHPGLTGSQDHQVRADMTLHSTNGGGAVFSVGSSNWISALPVDGFDNAAARITENVLVAFMKRGRLKGSRLDSEDHLEGRGLLSF